MITSFIITNHLNESITLELARPEQSGLAVLGVEGLGPVKANVLMSEMAGFDGAFFNSAKATKRNIVFRLGYVYKGVETIQDARHKVSKYFPLKRPVTVTIISTNRTLYTVGYVESNEPSIFSRESGTVVSLLCPDSYLYDVNEMVTSFGTVTPEFMFPFSNESLVSDLLEISSMTFDSEESIIYPGEADAGIVITIHAVGNASGITITNSVTLENMEIDSTKLAAIVGSDITTGDIITISTVRGDKYATLLRSGTLYNIRNALGKDPTWFQLSRGSNTFSYTATSGLANLEFEITNLVAYEGI